MANTDQMQQCVALLTEIVNRQGIQDWLGNVEEMIKYLNPISGEKKELSHLSSKEFNKF